MATTSDRTPLFIDTNILVSEHIDTVADHAIVHAALVRMMQAGAEFWLSRQVLREYAALLTRPQPYTSPLPATVVATQLRAFERLYRIADETAAVTEHLIALLESVPVGGKQIHDANIVATMQAYGIGRLLTLNGADFRRFEPLITILAPEEVLR